MSGVSNPNMCAEIAPRVVKRAAIARTRHRRCRLPQALANVGLAAQGVTSSTRSKSVALGFGRGCGFSSPPPATPPQGCF